MSTEKTFIEWWEELPPNERDRATSDLSWRCHVSLAAVKSWGLGYRVPRGRLHSLIADYMQSKGVTTASNLFPPCVN